MRTLALMLALAWAGCTGSDESGGGDRPEAPETAATLPAPAPHNTLTPDEVAAGWQLLFDGVSTTGWRAHGEEGFAGGGWSVVEGALTTLPAEEGGRVADIVSQAVFSDFELRFEFLVTPVGNSGVFYRVVEHEGAGLWEVAPEYQVLDDSAYLAMDDMDMTKHLTGDNYDLQSSAVAASNPVGEWNHGRIVLDGAQVEHWLNGQMTVAYELWSAEWEAQVAVSKFAEAEHYGRATEGRIALQAHGGDIRYRNIKIRPLEDDTGGQG